MVSLGVVFSAVTFAETIPNATSLSASLAGADGKNAIVISWRHSPAAGTSYRFLIQRKERKGAWVALENNFQSSTPQSYSYRDASVPPGEYSYRVRACRNGGAANCSADWVTALPINLRVRYVPPPSSLYIELTSFTEAKLEWAYSFEPTTEFIIYRREAARVGETYSREGTFEEIGRVRAADQGTVLFPSEIADRLDTRTARFVDRDLTYGNRYFYYVVSGRYDETAAVHYSAPSSTQFLTSNRFSLSKDTLCSAFQAGTIENLLNSENTDLHAINFLELREQSHPAVSEKDPYGQPLSEADKDYRGFLNMRDALSGNVKAYPQDNCNGEILTKNVNRIVIIPGGTYQLKRVKANFINPPTQTVSRYEMVNGVCRQVTGSAAVRPTWSNLITAFPGTDLQIGSDIQISNGTRFRIIGCPDASGAKPKISVAGNFERTPSAAIPVNGTTARLNVDAIIPLRFNHVSNFTVEGLEFDGNSARTKRSDPRMEGQGSAIRTHDAQGYLLNDLVVHHMTYDGIYIGNGSTTASSTQFIADRNVRIHRLISRNNTRIALMVAQANGMMVSMSTLSRSGMNGAGEVGLENPDFPRLDPAAGVDVEPNTVMKSVKYGNRVYQAEMCSAAVQAESKGKACASNFHVVLRKYTGIESLPPVDILSGNIAFENCLFNQNLGRMFQSALKAESVVPLTENITVRNSIFRPQPAPSASRAAELLRTDNFGLITRNAVIDGNDMDFGYGRLQLSHGTDIYSSQTPHASLRFEHNLVRSSGAIDDEGAFHPMWIRDNVFESTHPSDFPQIFSSAFNETTRPTWRFINVQYNPRAIFANNQVSFSEGLSRATARPFRILGRKVYGNSYSATGANQLAIDFGENDPGATSYSLLPGLQIIGGNHQTERADEVYGPGMRSYTAAPCNWTTNQVFRTNRDIRFNLAAEVVCNPEAPQGFVEQADPYDVLLPSNTPQ